MTLSLKFNLCDGWTVLAGSTTLGRRFCSNWAICLPSTCSRLWSWGALQFLSGFQPFSWGMLSSVVSALALVFPRHKLIFFWSMLLVCEVAQSFICTCAFGDQAKLYEYPLTVIIYHICHTWLSCSMLYLINSVVGTIIWLLISTKCFLDFIYRSLSDFWNHLFFIEGLVLSQHWKWLLNPLFDSFEIKLCFPKNIVGVTIY